LTKTVTHRERLKKQTGGSGLFADMEFSIGPADESNSWQVKTLNQVKTRMQFVWDIFGGSIDKSYMPSVTKGFESMMNQGILAGYNIENMKIRVFDGSMHPVDSKPQAFELCAKDGFREAAPKTGSTNIEPIMKLEVITPEEYVGPVIGDLNRRRGLPKGQEARMGGAVAIQADVPLSEMFGYVTQLKYHHIWTCEFYNGILSLFASAKAI
jgi:elongation factor G